MAALTAQELDDLAARFPLPAGVGDVLMNRNELATAFGVTALTITAWKAAGMPVVEEGRQGQEYVFRNRDVWAWKHARDADEATRSSEAQAAAAAMRLALIGGRSGDSIQALPPKERAQLYEVEAAYDRLKRERNQLLDRDETRETMTEVMRLCRDGVSALPDRLERDISLDARGVAMAIEHCDDVLETMEAAIRAFFAARPIKAPPEGAL